MYAPRLKSEQNNFMCYEIPEQVWEIIYKLHKNNFLGVLDIVERWAKEIDRVSSEVFPW